MAQSQFLCVHRSTPRPNDSGKNASKPSPEDMQAMYKAFEAWRSRFADSLVDLGGRLLPEAKVVSSDGIEDGPLAEAKEVIGGYMIVQADDLAGAADIVQAMPGIGPGSKIEIRPIQRPQG